MNRLDFSIIVILFYLADMLISYLQQENKAHNYEVSDARVQLVEPNLKHIALKGVPAPASQCLSCLMATG